ncbi:MAG: ferredoxin:glutaredoxin reductase [Planctomycetes bacterium]|nr:ferredoxin:glutaredoxin reductase [Planctomycetota bacterium]
MTFQAPSPDPSPSEIDALFSSLDTDARSGGYNLNPDSAFTRELVSGLIVNQRRYGYPSCPCRLASGDARSDLDIVCPCYYRDADLDAFGSCYCGLYVSDDVVETGRQVSGIPERRPPEELRRPSGGAPATAALPPLKYPVWRCQVCGYLCAREQPPGVCPVCKAKKERFERLL